MDSRHGKDLREGTRVAVFMGAAVAEVYGTPPIVTTGTVMGAADNGLWWVSIDIAAGETLPQMYRVEEIIGYLMPMATVVHGEDGSITGTLPLQ